MSLLCRRLFSLMSCPIWVLDLDDMRFTEASDSALSLWGIADLEALNTRLKASSSKLFRARLRSYRGRVADGSSLKETWTFFPGGRPTKRAVTLSGHRDEAGPQCLIGEILPAPLETSAEQGHLVATISHDLRTPMHSIFGCLELLEDAALTPDHMELLHTARGAAEGMITLLDDLLDAAKLAAGRLALEAIPMNLRGMARRCRTLAAMRLGDKAVSIEVEVDEDFPQWILGDPTRVQQVIMNLLSNAVKFTERGWVRLEIGLSGPDVAVIKVQDTGVGMRPQAVSQIFEAYTQADTSVQRHFGGTGLGLAICRELVERMGGQIEVESQLSRGTLFWFTLPFTVIEGPHSIDVETSSVDREGLTLLVAEDNPVNQRLIELMLTRLGHAAHVIADGTTVLERWREGRYDAILMDVQMPGVDGLTATRALIEAGCTVPIIGITANVGADDVQHCLKAGMIAVLGKPYRQAQLAKVLSECTSGAPEGRPTVVERPRDL